LYFFRKCYKLIQSYHILYFPATGLSKQIQPKLQDGIFLASCEYYSFHDITIQAKRNSRFRTKGNHRSGKTEIIHPYIITLGFHPASLVHIIGKEEHFLREGGQARLECSDVTLKMGNF
jgi:hypothetical protein